MSRITDPGPNGTGKKAWRHLRDDERAMLARYAAKHGIKKTRETFGISGTLVRSSCERNNIRPAPHKFLDLRAIAAGSKGMSVTDAAAKFNVARATVSKARKLYPHTEVAA